MASTSGEASRRAPVAVYVGPKENEDLERAVVEGGGRCVAFHEAEAIVWTGSSRDGFLEEIPPLVRWVQLPAAGVEAWFKHGIFDRASATFTSAAGAFGPTVAEHALSLLLLGARDLHHWVRATSWTPHVVGVLEGATVTVVGAGGVGEALFRLLGPLETTNVAVTRSGRDVPGAHVSIASGELAGWWPRSDYVVLAAPSSAATHHMVGRAELEAMPAHAWLVNVGRGALVDTDALVAALEDGAIRGAALDVTDPEPLPDGHALWGLANAVITPHVANPKPALRRRLAARVTENVRRFAAGEELLAVVDPERGY